MQLKNIGAIGLVLGLAVYGCSSSDSKSGGGSGGSGAGDTGGSAGDASGGSSAGGTSSGGATGGGAGDGMGEGGMNMGGMGGGMEPLTLEEACEKRCERYVATDCDDTQQQCEDDCLADAEDFGEHCGEEHYALVACEAQDDQSGFECDPMFNFVKLTASSACWDPEGDYFDCLEDNYD